MSRPTPAEPKRTFRLTGGRLTTDRQTVERAEKLVEAMPQPAPSAAAASEMPPGTDDRIRTRAYELWEAAGRPSGDGVEFWSAAERELAGK